MSQDAPRCAEMRRDEPGLSQIERDGPLGGHVFPATPPFPASHPPTPPHTLAGRHRQGVVHGQRGRGPASLLHLTYISATSRVHRQKHNPRRTSTDSGEGRDSDGSQKAALGPRKANAICVQAEPRPREKSAASEVPHGHRRHPQTHARRRSLLRRRCSSLCSSGRANRSTYRSDPAAISPRSRRDVPRSHRDIKSRNR